MELIESCIHACCVIDELGKVNIYIYIYIHFICFAAANCSSFEYAHILYGVKVYKNFITKLSLFCFVELGE